MMFKNKIAKKLALILGGTLIIFSFIICSLFIIFYTGSTYNKQKVTLVQKADDIANTLANYMTKNGTNMHFNTYLNFIDDMGDYNIWVVDKNSNLVTTKSNMGMHKQIVYEDLPTNADKIINQVLADNTVFSDDFNNLLSSPSLTIGTPIIKNNEVIGALLLHTPIDGLNSALYQGIIILLISITLALLVGIILTSIFAIALTKPLNIMKNNASKLINKDYTARNNIHLNDEIGQLAMLMDILGQRLEESLMESQKLDQLRQNFIANVSHELKTPVTVMRGSLEALADGVISDHEKIQTYYQSMLKESIFLQRLINDLLDLSKLQNMSFKINKSEFILNDLINDVLRNSRQLANTKNIMIIFDDNNLQNNLISIYGDYDRIRQMIMIIIDNAIKFSNKNSTIDIDFTNKTLSITDYGCGIPSDEIEFIFDRFHKKRDEQNKNGSGLGLAIAKEIALRHDINLQVKSDSNQTTFYIIFKDITIINKS